MYLPAAACEHGYSILDITDDIRWEVLRGWRFGIFAFSTILKGETLLLFCLAMMGLKEAFGKTFI